MPRTAATLARDEEHWHGIARQFEIEPGPINLENGYFGRMTRKVLEAYQHNLQWVNRSNSVHVRQRFEQTEALQIRRQLAELLEAPENAVALTRCASDALQSLIRNYNRLQPGDQVLLSDLEYDTVKSAMRWLARQRGVEVIEIQHLHPASFDSLVDTYKTALQRHPRIRLMPLTHVTHRSGLVMPVQAIAAVAREFGVDIILDGAHALGQIDFDLPQLGIAFAGFNLHKWIGAPLSLGFLYIHPDRLHDIDPDMGEFHFPADDIRARTPYSTPNIPALMTLPQVFEEHRAMGGSAAKGARLNYLRETWTEAVREVPGIEVMTPQDPRLCCAISALRFTRHPDQQALVDRLLRDYNLFTVARNGAGFGPCIRITPGLATPLGHMQQLVEALTELASQ
ncbi:aminotransferase class V-fold PLP-dependent enzyme [Pseudomonas sp. PH1b]|uniref:aminotransferase class V-fold PLP-dependent enzyme n=1 Tax=Pseudomonas sp. PH1b TaxID=1397282 RepID=UPI000468776B|nr:aminotransferase class V-fold PLP-dependent enzyme [Pseudomonas sp. PH1b]